ncbi:MAG TPA: DUF4136 domain-containing protein [Noviherbaspirillum sp.]
MKSWVIAFILAASTVLTGCGTFIKSDVTSFHDWPSELADKSFVFERTKEQNDSLEYLNYENLVRDELQRLGFVQAPANTKPALKVSISYSINGRDVREVYPVVLNPYPYWYGPAWRGYYGPYHGPFYDPFWFGPPIVETRVSQYQLFTRRLHIAISRMSDGKKLWEATVVSEGSNGNLAAVMPYMVRSAFADFPGKSGVPRQIELKMDQ